jgi:hypothetical protein
MKATVTSGTPTASKTPWVSILANHSIREAVPEKD